MFLGVIIVNVGYVVGDGSQEMEWVEVYFRVLEVFGFGKLMKYLLVFVSFVLRELVLFFVGVVVGVVVKIVIVLLD